MDTRHLQQSPSQLDMLDHLLVEETRQYETAVEILTRKKEVLISGNPQKLAQLDQELLTLSQKAKTLEQQRLQLLADLGFPNCALTQVIAELQPSVRPGLSQRRERLLRAIQDSDRLNRDSRDLLDLSLRWIQDTVEVIANALTPEAASYTSQGGKPGQQSSGTVAMPARSTISRSV